MSAVEAAQPLRRRALERQGMTREQELELLVQEQQADDVYWIGRSHGEFTSGTGNTSRSRIVSLEAPMGESGMRIADFLAVDDEGEVISFLRRHRESVFLVSFRHASFDAYNNHGCRCRPCKNFMAEYRRAKRAA